MNWQGKKEFHFSVLIPFCGANKLNCTGNVGKERVVGKNQVRRAELSIMIHELKLPYGRAHIQFKLVKTDCFAVEWIFVLDLYLSCF